jgi:hypothetical protein
MDTNQLISKPVCRIQKASGLGQQDEVLDGVTRMDWTVAIRHVTQGPNSGTGELRRRWVQLVTMHLEKFRPVKNDVIAYLLARRDEF